MNIQQAASALLEAEKKKKSIEPFTSSTESISVDEVSLKKGERILAGSLSKAVSAEDGDHLNTAFENLGIV